MAAFPNEILFLIAEKADIATLKVLLLSCKLFLESSSLRKKLFEQVIVKADSQAFQAGATTLSIPDATAYVRKLTLSATPAYDRPRPYPHHVKDFIEACAPKVTQIGIREDNEVKSHNHASRDFEKWRLILSSFEFPSFATLHITLSRFKLLRLRKLFDPVTMSKEARAIFGRNLAKPKNLQIGLIDGCSYDFLDALRTDTLASMNISSLVIEGNQTSVAFSSPWEDKLRNNLRSVKFVGLRIINNLHQTLETLDALEELDIFCCSLDGQRDTWIAIFESLKSKNHLRKLTLECLHYYQPLSEISGPGYDVMYPPIAFDKDHFLDRFKSFVLEKGISIEGEIGIGGNRRNCKQCTRSGDLALCLGPNGCCRRLY